LTTPLPKERAAAIEPGLFDNHYLLNAWLGRKALWAVFWPFFLIVNISIYWVDSITIAGQLSVSSWDDVYFILITPTIIWSIVVWRNSKNTRFQIWALLARFFVLSVYFEYTLKWIIRFDYARLFFNCNEVVLDYAACF
jgi:hypothetical protein